MPASFKMYDTTGAVINDLNPIVIGVIQAGMISPIATFWLWNDKDGLIGAATALAPRIFATSTDEATNPIFAGTTANSNRSMLQARSCRSTNTPSDMHNESQWTEISPISTLKVGPMPKNSSRQIELRLVVPYDATTFASANFDIRVYE